MHKSCKQVVKTSTAEHRCKFDGAPLNSCPDIITLDCTRGFQADFNCNKFKILKLIESCQD